MVNSFLLLISSDAWSDLVSQRLKGWQNGKDELEQLPIFEMASLSWHLFG